MSKDIMPQLRVRSEFSFRRCYGRVDQIADRLQEIGCTTAAMVDQKLSTWGHAPWEKALSKINVQPAFGAEIPIHLEGKRKPAAWALAEDTKRFYNFMSSGPKSEDEFKDAGTGIIRFPGAALTDPDAFDYVDLNPLSLSRAERSIELAKRSGKKLILTSDNDYPALKNREHFLAWADAKKMTPQHILGESEMRAAFWWLDENTYQAARLNSFEVAERLQGISLPAAPMIQFDGDLDALIEKGRKYRLEKGHIKDWTDEYQKRLEREIGMIKHKRYESYFLVVSDLIAWAKKRMLVGPGRGSSAGSLVCYLLEITEVDPIPHGLLFERFIDVNRDDLPDIDIDFNDKKRWMCFEYLEEKYGKENVARIGSLNLLKPRSVMAHAGKALGIPRGATFSVLNVLIEHSSGDARYGKGLEDTLNDTQPGRDFMTNYPEAELMGDLEMTASHTGVHAAGIIVSNEPVTDYCTVIDGIAQVDKKGAEYLNLLKIDALGLRTLGVIEDTGCVTPELLYGLPTDDPEVFKIFNEQKYVGVFQFEGQAQRSVSAGIKFDNFRKIDHATALARPGPLGGGAAHKYVERAAGREPVVFRHETMEPYLGETFGVVLYQEQVMRIVRELGQFSWEETSVIRKAMSGRKGQEFFDAQRKKFVKGAEEIGVESSYANEIWDEIYSFGAWGMNKSHTTSYAFISYWCAYMKRYHPLEFAAACLRGAKDDDQTVEILRELNAEGIEYLPFDPQLSRETWHVADGKLVGGYTNLIGIGPAKAAAYVKKRDKGGLTEKDLEKIAKHKVQIKDLHPGHTKWGDIYRNPHEYNIAGKVQMFAELDDFENGVVICQLKKKDRRDENEAVLVAKRNGEVKKGQTLFLDLHVVDDSVAKPIRARVRPNKWNEIGWRLADRAIDNEDWFLIRGKWLKGFSMMIVYKIKCLTNPALFNDDNY